WVEAVFSLDNQPRINSILKRYGIDPQEDGTLLLTRELSTSGKNLCRVNGRIVTLTTLKMLSKHLVDVHGQHQHQSLLAVEEHMQLLDMLGGNELITLKETTKQLYDQWKRISNRIKELSGMGMDGERRKDILIYQISEIENAGLVEGEEEELID